MDDEHSHGVPILRWLGYKTVQAGAKDCEKLSDIFDAPSLFPVDFSSNR